MSRKIYLPELLSITVKNYTLYPNGLDYTYNFVKGVNLILGGNGMGKTTFVNMIKFALIGPYRQQYSYTRTYRDKKIEKRLLNKCDYFSSRMDGTMIADNPLVTLRYRLNQTELIVTRSLDDSMAMQSCIVDGCEIKGVIVSHSKYESLNVDEKRQTILHKYEEIVESLSKLPFDDLILFVNEVLFFGEDHKTILWGDNQDVDVQNELFNKYFNDPKLDLARQEAERQTKYYDSLARHRSEDMRAINKVLSKLPNGTLSKGEAINNLLEGILQVGKELEKTDQIIERLQYERNLLYKEISTNRHKKNELSLRTLDVDRKKEQIESSVNATKWEKVNPRYSVYLRNIHQNHICPLCNQESEMLFARVEAETNKCFVCGQDLKREMSAELSIQYQAVQEEQKEIYREIEHLDRLIRSGEERMQKLDLEFGHADNSKRELLQRKRELEYANSMSGSQGDIQAFYDEIRNLSREKEEFQLKSIQEREKAVQISQKIRQSILQNVKYFSQLFSEYAGLFLGVKCELTYDKNERGEERFYPVIDGQVRWREEELSESQRFFVDHSFRMSILSFFYTTPTFYIVETPDSSLDISYEYNAAQVFRHFLRVPNVLIITSNLNKSSFLENLVENEPEVIPVSMIGLLDIAKQSAIQSTSDAMREIYYSLKQKINYERTDEN